MASAGRPFTVQTLRDLRDRGIGLATISLHAGLSTYGDPATDRRYVPAEPYLVPEATAAAVAACRAAGGRVVAVGTTVVRTLETAAAGDGHACGPGPGVSRLRIGPGYRLAVVDGLLTGLHEPEASHLDLLAAFLDRPALDRAYAAALASGYLWHEFGDVCLLLPRRSAPTVPELAGNPSEVACVDRLALHSYLRVCLEWRSGEDGRSWRTTAWIGQSPGRGRPSTAPRPQPRDSGPDQRALPALPDDPGRRPRGRHEAPRRSVGGPAGAAIAVVIAPWWSPGCWPPG